LLEKAVHALSINAATKAGYQDVGGVHTNIWFRGEIFGKAIAAKSPAIISR
jgi:hypothetical protein